MRTAAFISAFASIAFCGAIFGFFYAWVCSTMWGLDQTDPNTAIKAMQAMNASVRNAVFAPAFFGTPLVLLVTAGLAFLAGPRSAALFFGLAALVYLAGAFAVTVQVNVPMNQALAEVKTPLEEFQAAGIWTSYSTRWQTFNQLRTIASGIALLLAGAGLSQLARAT
jgi:uncharacterized membrane protein